MMRVPQGMVIQKNEESPPFDLNFYLEINRHAASNRP